MMHTGAVFGAQAIIMLIPDREVGFSVAINCEDGEAALGIAYELLDHYLEQPRYDWAAPGRRSCGSATSGPWRS